MKINETQIKKQITLARKTVTSIQTLVKTHTLLQKNLDQLKPLSLKESQQLEKATAIINEMAFKYSGARKLAKAAEDKAATIHAAAQNDAKNILLEWKVDGSFESKVAIIMAVHDQRLLTGLLSDENTRPEEIEDLFKRCLADFIDFAASKVNETKKITEILDIEKSRYDKNIRSIEVKDLAAAWQNKFNSKN